MPSAPQFFGRYEVLEVIGQGAMGVVYRARDPLIERDVAIKTLPIPHEQDGSEAQHKELLVRIVREIQAAGALSHPNIAAVHDIGETDESIFIVMELVEGSSLERLLDDNALPMDRAGEVIRQVAIALDHAHSREVIHRDVKPANILINRQGQVKLVDFGIAKTLAGGKLTRTGIVVGTPEYMAPEQLKEIQAGPTADQYSLAVTAYRILTGRLPFEADSVSELLTKALREKPQPAKEAPVLAAKALMRALSKNPEQRFTSCLEFSNALQLHAAAVPVEAPASRFPLKAVGAVAVLLAVLALGLFWSRPRPSDPAPVSPSVEATMEAAPQPVLDPPASVLPPAVEQEAVIEPKTPAPSQSRPQATVSPPPAVQPPTLNPTGPVVEIVWRGSLEPNAALLVQDGRADSGELSAALPVRPISVEVSPPGTLQIVETPSVSNGWARLRIVNQGRTRSLFLIRYRNLSAAP